MLLKMERSSAANVRPGFIHLVLEDISRSNTGHLQRFSNATSAEKLSIQKVPWEIISDGYTKCTSPKAVCGIQYLIIHKNSRKL